MTKLSRWPLMVSAIVAVGIVGTFACQSRPANGGVAVGVVFPLTGDAASYGEKGREAIELAAASVASKGGCGRHRINVVYEDSRADPTTGVAAFRKLITADGVPVVIGDIVSGVTLAAAPIAEANHVLLLSPTSSAPAITDAGQFIYRTWPSDLAEGQAIATFALQRGYRRASVLHVTNDYGAAIAQIFKHTFEGGGGQVVSIDGYQVENTDFRTPLTRILTLHPDVLYVAGYFGDTAPIVRQARELGLQVQILGTTSVEDNQFLTLAGRSAEGLIYPMATGFDANSTDPRVHDFVQSFRARYQHDPGWVEVQAYDAFMLVCHAMSTIDGEVTGTKMKAKFDSLGSFEGIAGPIRFDANGDVTKPVMLRIVQNGRFTPLASSR